MHFFRSRFSRLIVLGSFTGFVALFSTGCGTLGYLVQAGRGQMALINHAKPISEVLKDEKTPPRIKGLLAEIPAIKKYGEENSLKATKNYTEYVKLDRPAAVWVVSASEPLRFKSKEWNFPIVGSFPYLGWFDLKDGREFASELRKEGWDVDLRGAAAYSTLGWFRDAILSSMIPDGPEALGELVNVVLHESVHATFYINGESYFDESIASFIADKMTPVYLEKTRGKDSSELHAYEQGVSESARIRKRLHEAYLALKDLYASPLSDAEKLERKNKLLAELRTDIKAKRELNNATLIQYKAYNTGGKEFEELYQACKGDWTRFWGAIKHLTRESFREGQQENLLPVLAPLKEWCR